MEKLEKTPFGVGIPGAVNISGSFTYFDEVCMHFDMYVKTETIQASLNQLSELQGSEEEKSEEIYNELWDKIHYSETSIYDFGKALLNYICLNLDEDVANLCKNGGAGKINFIMEISGLDDHQITVTSSFQKGWGIPNCDNYPICNSINFEDSDIYFPLPTRLELLDSNELHFLFEIVKVLRTGIDSTCYLRRYDLEEFLQKDNKVFRFYDKYLIERTMKKFGRLGLTEDLFDYAADDRAVFYDIELYEYYFPDVFKDKAA